jgi:hypothetical protein
MADMNDILVNVLEDLTKRVGRVQSGIEPQVKWVPYEANAPKEPDQGHSRSYTLKVQGSKGVTFGSTSNDFEVLFNLEVTYEHGPVWTLAAGDDYEAIVSAVQRTWTISTGFPTGLDFYTIGDMVLTEDEFFQTMTIPITARIVADVRS